MTWPDASRWAVRHLRRPTYIPRATQYAWSSPALLVAANPVAVAGGSRIGEADREAAPSLTRRPQPGHSNSEEADHYQVGEWIRILFSDLSVYLTALPLGGLSAKREPVPVEERRG